MCGGSGTRMWPESRESLPKQFIPLIGQRSTFQTIVSVVGDSSVFDPAVVITNYEYRFRVAEQLREIGAEAEILLEPDRRDSAAAVGAAAVWAAARDPKTVVAILAAERGRPAQWALAVEQLGGGMQLADQTLQDRGVARRALCHRRHRLLDELRLVSIEHAHRKRLRLRRQRHASRS